MTGKGRLFAPYFPTSYLSSVMFFKVAQGISHTGTDSSVHQHAVADAVLNTTLISQLILYFSLPALSFINILMITKYQYFQKNTL